MDDIASDRRADEAAERLRRGRAAQRDSLFLLAMMRRADDAAATIRVRNLSRTGLMAEVTAAFGPGDSVEIDLRGIGVIEAQVMWREDSRVGIHFRTPIDPRMARKPVVSRAVAVAPAAPPVMRRARLFGN